VKLTTILSGYFKLDGGAMFGVVPQTLWQRVNPPDAKNLCTWAARLLLIETGDRKILVDTGMGDKQDEKFRSHFEPHGEETMTGELLKSMILPEEITDVFLTHLHFDHAGGAVKYDELGNLVPTFPNATYWTNEKHWQHAMQPNMKEKASFLKENFVPLQKEGRLKMIDVQDDRVEWLPGIKVRFAHGHTESLMALEVQLEDKKLIYGADLMPASYYISLPWVMSYDIRPLVSLEEKSVLLTETLDNGDILFFEHDPRIECGTLKRNEKGRIVLDKALTLVEALK
jgi:glyoxylase-like metal-dependent hydrolase (beta-lactamase superfamily II)